jgi:hypothetical protein
MEVVLKPVLRLFFTQSYYVNPAGINLPADWTGIADFDFETWRPKLTRYNTATASVTSWGDNAGEYFVRWCRTGSPGFDASKALPANHFTYCALTSQLTTDQAAEDLFWSITYRMWAAIKEVMLEQAPGAKLGCYGWPEVPHYNDISFYGPTQATEFSSRATVDAKIAAKIAERTSVTERTVTALFDVHEPSFYCYGTVLAEGVAEVVTHPTGSPYQWSYWQKSRDLFHKATVSKAVADYYGKPIVAYIKPTTVSGVSELEVDARNMALTLAYLVGIGVDGYILWATYGGAGDDTKLYNGLVTTEPYIDNTRAARKPFAATPTYQ